MMCFVWGEPCRLDLMNDNVLSKRVRLPVWRATTRSFPFLPSAHRLEQGSLREKAFANIEAIETDNRHATQAEQAMLARSIYLKWQGPMQPLQTPQAHSRGQHFPSQGLVPRGHWRFTLTVAAEEQRRPWPSALMNFATVFASSEEIGPTSSLRPLGLGFFTSCVAK